MTPGGMTPAFDNQETMESLREGLANLPAPKNDFEIVLPEELPDGVHQEELDGERAADYVVDMGDEEAKHAAELKRLEEVELSKRHEAVKRRFEA